LRAVRKLKFVQGSSSKISTIVQLDLAVMGEATTEHLIRRPLHNLSVGRKLGVVEGRLSSR
jgi:hypothetical protein